MKPRGWRYCRGAVILGFALLTPAAVNAGPAANDTQGSPYPFLGTPPIPNTAIPILTQEEQLSLTPLIDVTINATKSIAHANRADLASVQGVVHECVKRIRQEATAINQYGRLPLWKKFDAYLSPDWQLHNNARFVGEMEGLYRFEKCLAEEGISLVIGQSSVSEPIMRCSIKEPLGGCWSKLDMNSKLFLVHAFMMGWLHSDEFNRKQQYEWSNTPPEPEHIFPRWDFSKLISFLDELYREDANHTIYLSDAFDLALRMQTNPETKDIPQLIRMYRAHQAALFSGYLRKFIPPNKVVISQHHDAELLSPGQKNQLNTITLFGVSTVKDTSADTGFMSALLNVKSCHTLIHETERYKYYVRLSDEKRLEAKDSAERNFYSQLKVYIKYPVDTESHQEEFFNEDGELSGVVFLEKGEDVCAKAVRMREWQREQGTGPYYRSVTLGEVMFGAKDEEPPKLEHGRGSVNLNGYLIANGLGIRDENRPDPRRAARGCSSEFVSQCNVWFTSDFVYLKQPNGVRDILAVGASRRE